MVTHTAHDVRREDAIGPPPASPTRVPAARYYSPEFARLEREHLWPRVWQLACTLDHVAEPGDYFEY
ncbi:MAG: aromatic ring-hydroxylating dioxygenase subunit alpha, partial [Mycolicibacterium aromaticivorans]|nr:aromatic ring-hydroxylating dioxygenase subunit alpha [Mycolicibacterium aromaticivorans]